MSVINLSDYRQPVTYTVRITHHWDDSIEVLVEDVADDERSRQSVADALARAANTFGNRTVPMPEEIERLTRERDEALEEIRCLGLSEPLAKHSGSPSREWHSVGAWLYPGETINHVFRSPRTEPEDRP